MGIDPISIGLLIGGTLLKTVGSLQEGAAASGAAAYKSQVADYNAVDAIRAGDVEATNESLKNRARLGKIKAGFAGSGVDVNTGSAASVFAAQSGLGELDALTIRSDAARKSFGYKTQAKLYDAEAENAKTASYISAASSLVSGASQAYGMMPESLNVGASSSGATMAPWDWPNDTFVA